MQQSLAKLIRTRSVLAGLWFFVLALALGGCDGPSETNPPDPEPDAGPTPCVPGELTREDGTCQPAGLPPDMPCPPGELLLDDGITCQPAGLPLDMPCPPGEWLREDGITCQKAGVPASECGEGFLPDGKDGCEPILPAEPCPEGLMAVPGDTECHEVAPCGSGTWGDIPVEPSTEFVDQAYAGGDSDGTPAKPWTTIQDGFYAAAKGAIVAVAAGSYVEDVVIKGKPVRLWGRCPALVEVVGTGDLFGAIVVLKNAGGAEIHGVAVTGPEVGIALSGSSDIVIESVWIHGTGFYGIAVQDDLGPTSVVLKGSLVEQNHGIGVFVEGSGATIEATVVRSTLPSAQELNGRGISIQNDPDTNERSNVTVRGCLAEQNHGAGVFVAGSGATIETTVVRSTLPDAEGSGSGIEIQTLLAAEERASVTVRACLVEQNHGIGVYVGSSDATIEATVVRSTLTNALGEGGYGIHINDRHGAEERANVTVRACLVEQNHDLGVVVSGSVATIEATLVRSTLPDAQEKGGGIFIHNDPATKERANVTVRACLVEQNHDSGVFIAGSNATIEATVVRSTLPGAQGIGGRGIHIQNDPDDIEGSSNVTVRACLVEQNHEVGVFVVGSDATIDSTVVHSTLPDMEGDGYGIEAVNANLTVRACLVEENQERGVLVEGSGATIESSVVRSNNLSDARAASGRGINIQGHPDAKKRANVTVRACVIEQHHEDGVFVAGWDATIENTVIRSTQPEPQWEVGRGIDIQDEPATKERANVMVRACVIEQNHDLGVFVQGSDVTIEATVVGSTQSDAQGKYGRGINIQTDPDTNERSTATIRGCVIEKNHDIGVYVSRSNATIVDSIVRDTAPQKSDGEFGDGIAVLRGDVILQNTDVTFNARAGVAAFGAQVEITGGVLICNGFDLEGEVFDSAAFSFDGSTGWECSGKAPAECTELGECHVETNSLKAPAELPPVDPQ